ncbi:MAG: DEAD/DEAH box helicase family protein, partial [Bacillota bacterium]
MFDFQKYVADRMIQKGRHAGFLDTGTGKTIIELTIAANYVKETNKPVLIITPLAVADQHLTEAEKFCINDVEHTKNGKYKGKIILINYERLHYL